MEVDLKEIINSILDIGNTIKEGIVKQSVKYKTCLNFKQVYNQKYRAVTYFHQNR